MSKWANRSVLDPEHHRELDTSAAIYEFKHRMPRHAAEEQAYNDYIKSHAITSAAHHLLGMRAAHAVGNDSAAAAHHESYSKALRHLGVSSDSNPPPEVLNRAKSLATSIYDFRSHVSDKAVPEPKSEDNLASYLDKIQEIRAKLRTKP